MINTLINLLILSNQCCLLMEYLIICFQIFQFVPILFVISTSSMLIMDQRTMQIKYRIPASEIIRLSLSPYFDDIAVFHVKAVSYS